MLHRLVVVSGPAHQDDVAPQDEVADMVTRERTLPNEGQERDLLDSSKLVE